MTTVLVLVFSCTNPVEGFSTERKGPSSPVTNLIDKPFYQAVESSHQLADRFQEQIDGFALLPGEMVNTWQLVAMGRSNGYPFLLLVQICLVLLSAILVESFLRKRFKAVFVSISSTRNTGIISRFSFRGVGLALEAFFLLVFVLVTFGLFVLIFPEKGPAAIIASNYFLAAYYIRVLFFLIDDAFRVGDYINTGTAKGLVEHISLRAVRLRHHRGMVQTVPFGKIGTVVNFSRDYIIMKLDSRVKYDTDVEKVRKVVKKIYQSLLLDEELGPKLIGKLKSQGVLKMDDSAMIMRIKFTTAPGEQFVMRKDILRRLQEAFRANDIEFAHRNVTVFMPEHDSKEPLSREMQGAATAAILNEERNSMQDKEPER